MAVAEYRVTKGNVVGSRVTVRLGRQVASPECSLCGRRGDRWVTSRGGYVHL